jgi:DNA-binding NtrC family response regulator
LILVVEDDQALRLLCRVNLELADFRVCEASTADQARAEVARERPKLVFLDVHLWNRESDELLDELRAEGIPVVLVSGTADVELYRGRATEVLNKPFEPAALVAIAERLAVG